MADHDSLYHRLFDHPYVVAEPLREFLPDVPLEGLDLDGMTRENAKFDAATGDRREGDMIWRIPHRHRRETYLLLLLEFQSTSDRWMALRVLVYAGLLWQHLVAEKRLPPDGRLPPILPVVLYNGDRPWAAPLALRHLIGLPDDSRLWDWQPAMHYLCVDEGAFTEADLARRDTLLALLFRLENSPDPAQVVVLADAVLAWFRGHPGFERVRPVFVEMLGAMLAPGLRVPDELLEMRNMLATRWEVWEQKRQEELREAVQAAVREAVQKAEQSAERRGEQRASRGAAKKVRRPSCGACWSAGSGHCLTGHGNVSPPPTPRHSKSGDCVYLTPRVSTTSWPESDLVRVHQVLDSDPYQPGPGDRERRSSVLALGIAVSYPVSIETAGRPRHLGPAITHRAQRQVP